ncbi:YciI family protein [Sandarakinorhabdus oryzae]|uniref:YciI family protein n=1 Tax=Sandarakinorhabdus oryzae TaxID=2675220 RepID=UPI0018CC4887|nr:YciI family protein [Sandarakinorhabdus oryzae]
MMSRLRHILVIGLALAAVPASAADYTLLIHETPAELAKRSNSGPAGQAYWQGFAAAGQQLAKAGALKGGAALMPTSKPGPGGLVLGGYFIITAANDAAARQLARALPAARGGRIDVIAHAPTKTGM